MAPNFMKEQTDTSKYIGTKPPTEENDPTNNNFRNYNPASGDNTSTFRTEGSVGKQFTSEGKSSASSMCAREKPWTDTDKYFTTGALGGVAQKIGGPLDKDGIVGRQFKEDGSAGQVANKLADMTEGKSK
ncbi:hypothetical protein B0A52_01084 [Exophiala mesophila]|uniref:Uncharacterized protein n=1 Tax=Exophiala mesophila TaxID=212818 RepID=A0A438NGG2_EXOME|nr:hypothetical protein B0A52_01084 [Exophiala mesophila]